MSYIAIAMVSRSRRGYFRLRCGILVWAVLLVAGCAGMADIRGTRDFMELYSLGDYLAAAGTLGGETALDYDEKNLLTSLQIGTALRAAGAYEASQTAFDRAEIGLLWKTDKITSVDELLSAGFTLVTNDLARSYQGNIYDGVLLNTFKAMNAVSLGDMDRARIELNRAEQRQTNAVEQLRSKVRALGADDPGEGENTQAQDEIDGALADVWKPDSPVAKRLAAVEALGQYQDLRNPFTDWFHGVFRLATGEANRASNLFRDAAVLDGQNNRFVLADLLLAEAAAGGSSGVLPERVWIIHEDGTGPYLDEFRFDFTVLTPDGPIVAGIALPEFVEGSSAVGTLAVTADGQSYRTEPLLNVDRYAATEFRTGYDAVVGKAVTSAVIRVVLQAVAQKEANEQGGLTEMLLNLGSTIGAVVLTQADTRTWTSLPKSIAVASLPRPPDGRLRITTSGRQTIYDDVLPAGRFVLITVKTVREGVSPSIHVAAFGE